MSGKKPTKRKPLSFKVWVWIGFPRLLRSNGQSTIYHKIPDRILRPAMVRATLTVVPDPPKKARGAKRATPQTIDRRLS